MSLPSGTLCRQDITAIEVYNFIYLNGFDEVVPSRHHLHDGFGVAAEHVYLPWADDEKDFPQCFAELMSVVPAAMGFDEPIALSGVCEKARNN